MAKTRLLRTTSEPCGASRKCPASEASSHAPCKVKAAPSVSPYSKVKAAPSVSPSCKVKAAPSVSPYCKVKAAPSVSPYCKKFALQLRAMGDALNSKGQVLVEFLDILRLAMAPIQLGD